MERKDPAPLKVGDGVRRIGPAGSPRVGVIRGFTRQGEVQMALVEWEGATTLPNPAPEVLSDLERVHA